MQKGDLIGLVTVVVILAGIGLLFAMAPKALEVAYAPVEIPGSSLTVGDQLDEQSVTVSAELKQVGFIAVHRAVGEAPGPIIGYTPLLAVGSHPNLSIDTTAPLMPQSEYFVLLFTDDGDGVYEPGVDLPVMSDGQVVKQKFSL